MEVRCKNKNEVVTLKLTELESGYLCPACGEHDRLAEYYDNHTSDISTRASIEEEFEKWFIEHDLHYIPNFTKNENGTYYLNFERMLFDQYVELKKLRADLAAEYPYQKTDEYLDHVKEIKELKADQKRWTDLLEWKEKAHDLLTWFVTAPDLHIREMKATRNIPIEMNKDNKYAQAEELLVGKVDENKP